MRFEWDLSKAQSNFKKHKVSFIKAIHSFDDPDALRRRDEEHSTREEQREWLIGRADDRVLVTVFTVRDVDLIRIISSRPASRREREIYEEFRNVSI